MPIGAINAGSIKFLKIQYDIEKLADLACDLVEDIKPRLFVLLRTMPGLEEIALWRFEERDITHMKACCLWHRPATTKYFMNTVTVTSRILIAALEDIVENQLKVASENREHGDTNTVAPKIYITDNQASVRLAIKGKSLRMKEDVSALRNRDFILQGSSRYSLSVKVTPKILEWALR
ncbi:hypothetical protein MMC18_003993, partial [Xylographa bjoerkii]|nr:hypothetical protein [Xylographa bjoerkii]